jgi:hypothetical protein
MGRGDGRGRVAPPAAVDEAADRERGGDQGEGRVGRPWQVARLCRRRRGDLAWPGGWRRRGAWPGGWHRRAARTARAGCGAEERGCAGDGIAEERERVDVATAVAGAAGPKAQAAVRPEGPEAAAEVGVGAAADGEVAEAQVGGDERAAADGDGQAVVRKRADERDAAGACGAHDRAGRSGDVDPPPLPAGERRVRREAEGADAAAAERPAPGGVRRDRSLPFARRRSARRHEERHDEAGDRQRDEDQRVWAWGHASTVCAVRRVPRECA